MVGAAVGGGIETGAARPVPFPDGPLAGLMLAPPLLCGHGTLPVCGRLWRSSTELMLRLPWEFSVLHSLCKPWGKWSCAVRRHVLGSSIRWQYISTPTVDTKVLDRSVMHRQTDTKKHPPLPLRPLESVEAIQHLSLNSSTPSGARGGVEETTTEGRAEVATKVPVEGGAAAEPTEEAGKDASGAVPRKYSHHPPPIHHFGDRRLSSLSSRNRHPKLRDQLTLCGAPATSS